MARLHDFRRFTRGLRFRLTASYALLFAVLAILVAMLFRTSLSATLDNQTHEVLDQEWAAMKGYLRIEKNEPYWYYDETDPDETFIVSRLKRVYLLADSHGNVLQSSTIYQSFGIDPPDKIQAAVRAAMAPSSPAAGGRAFWTVKRNPQGAPFLIRAGIVFDEGHHKPYYIALGTPLSESHRILAEFTLMCLLAIPLALIVSSLLGWFMAGRALTPVLAVQTAQAISGSNLSLRIPTRQADDELDYLILTFNRMIERLEASFQQIRQFSTDVSHELRTPISAIRGQLEVALFTASTTEQYREAMFNALQDIDRLSKIVRALFLLSQAESGQLALQKSRLNFSRVVEDLVDQFQIPAEAAGIRLLAELPPECPAHLDRVQIERMVTNLLSNAVKFTPNGGEVRVRLRSLADRIEPEVEDTGFGIAPEHQPHVFERFYRVPTPGSESNPEAGLGLGLSFVAWIAKAHGGRIGLHSSPGEGTRFTVTLPADGAPAGKLDLADQPAAI